MDPIYKIHWKDTLSGVMGESGKPMDYKLAESWKKYADEKYPYIEHTIKLL